MKNIILLIAMSCAATMTLVAASEVRGATTDGMDVVFAQPGVGEVKLRVIGNNYYARTETTDGYTVIYSAKDNTYYYALLNLTESALIASKLKVGIDDPSDLKKHLKLSMKRERKKALRARVQKTEDNPERLARWNAKVEAAKTRRLEKLAQAQQRAKENLRNQQPNNLEGEDPDQELKLPNPSKLQLNASAVNGNMVGLTILAQFPDDPATPAVDPIHFPSTVAKMERFCNETGYNDDGNSGSVKDYFSDQSEGALTYTMKVSPIVTLPQPKNYYNFSDYPTNSQIRASDEAGNLLVRDCIEVLKSQNYDFSGLTMTKFGLFSFEDDRVRSTNIFFAGGNSGVWTKGLWPHQYGMQVLDHPEITIDGNTRYINQYQITNLSSDSAKVGTFIHESGHLILDLPDLYDTNGGSSGLGRHDLMSSGNFSNNSGTPSPINLYLKDIVGWANITDILPSDTLSVSLPSTGSVGYRLTNPNNTDEFFIIENRGFTAGGNARDKWAEHVPDKGLMIWHVDEDMYTNQNQQMTATQHYRVSLEQQDGEFDLEGNRGSDSTDLYDSSSSAFNDASLPNAKWWSGTASGVQVRATSAPGVSMNVEFGYNNVVTVLAPNGGETVDKHSSVTVKWIANVLGNVKIDLYKGGAFLQTLSANEVNDGSYTWNLNGAFEVADDYTIRVISLNTPTSLDFSDSAFAITEELFVAQGLAPAGWVQSVGSSAGWEVSSAHASEGSYSLKNVNISENETAAVEYTTNTFAGVITFDAKVSTEAGYDKLKFYIDGVEQDLDAASANNYLSGDKDWSPKSFNITAGVHTFKWIYEKDASISGHEDTVWIDNVVIPIAPLTGIDLWASQQFTGNDPAVVGDSADPDKDGITNIMEYALGLNPNQPNITTGINVEQNGNSLSMIYPKNKNATDLNFIVESVADLVASPWAPYNGSESMMSSSGEVDMMKATMTMNPSDTTCFMRLRVERKTAAP